MATIMIIDGDNIAWRYAIMQHVECTGYVVRDIIENVKKFTVDGVFIVWDGGSTRRKLISKAYKENRHDVDPEMIQRKESLKKGLIAGLEMCGFIQCLIPNEEGDDIIAKLTNDMFVNDNVIIVSNDKDFSSLLSQRVRIWNGKEMATEESFRNEFGIDPKDWVKLRSLSGDSSDNIPGVKGIGIKRGLKILNDGKYPDFEQKDEVKLSKELLNFLDIDEDRVVEHLNFGRFNEFGIRQMCEVYRLSSVETTTELRKIYTAERAKIWRCSYLKTDMANCSRCSMRPQIKQVVQWDGTVKATIMFIGDVPGEDEDDSGTPFVGRAGSIFDSWLDYLGLKRKDVLITNTVWCRPVKDGKNRKPTDNEIAFCSQFGIDRLARYAMPQHIVCLGETAGSHVFGRKIRPTKEYGKYKSTKFGFEVIVWQILHPASLLYDSSYKRIAFTMLDEIKKELEKK